MLGLRSFFGLALSIAIHGSVGAYFLSHNLKEKPAKQKIIPMQMAMFKVAPPLKKTEIETKPVTKKPIEKAEPEPEKELVKKRPTKTPPINQKKEITKSIEKKPKRKPIAKKKKRKLKKKVKKKVRLKKKITQRRKIKPQKKVKVLKKPVRRPKKVTRPRTVVAKRVATPKVALHVRRAPPQKNVGNRQARPNTKQVSRAKPIGTIRAKPSKRQPSKPRVVGNPNLERQYQLQIRKRIEQKKRYPKRAKRMRKQGVVKVAFTLSKNGVVSNLRIAQSSGIKSLDEASLKAIKKVGRFPVFPAGMNKQLISYIIPISYRLR